MKVVRYELTAIALPLKHRTVKIIKNRSCRN